jgi:hypothetical protein
MNFRGCTLHALWYMSLRSMRLAPPDGIMDVVAEPKEGLRLARRREVCR